METMENTTSMNADVQLRNDELRRKRDEDMRDDDAIQDTDASDSKLPGQDNADEDDETLVDDDIEGDDLDTDDGDEWDPEKVDNDLDRRDLEDNDEANFDIHNVKNDQFGSLGRSITNEAEPDPDEIPEEHESGNEELDYPDNDRMEQGKDDEVSYTEQKEVTQPNTGEPTTTTVSNTDGNFSDDKHNRTSGRLLDHEPGAGINPPEHGAYNL